MRYIDLFACKSCLEEGRALGWDGFAVVGDFGGDFRGFLEGAKVLGSDVYTAALVSSEPQKKGKAAVDAADLVIVDGRTEDACREASESWETDLIVNPELNMDKDPLKQRASGLDDVILPFMAQRGIGYLINAGNLLHSSGVRRVRLIARITQNVMMCRRYGVRVAISSGARDRFDVRSPDDLINLGRMLGLTQSAARDAVSRNPGFFFDKATDRKDPELILAGLRVKSWGRAQARSKRRHGWY